MQQRNPALSLHFRDCLKRLPAQEAPELREWFPFRLEFAELHERRARSYADRQSFRYSDMPFCDGICGRIARGVIAFAVLHPFDRISRSK